METVVAGPQGLPDPLFEKRTVTGTGLPFRCSARLSVLAAGVAVNLVAAWVSSQFEIAQRSRGVGGRKSSSGNPYKAGGIGMGVSQVPSAVMLPAVNLARMT